MTRNRNSQLLADKPCAVWVLLLLASVFAAPTWAQQPLPQHFTDVLIEGLEPFELVYRIDLDTLPPRPRLIVEVTPSSPFEDMELEIRLENWTGATGGPGWCYEPTAVFVETEPSGPVTLIESLYNCDPDADRFNSGEVDVVVRALNFGAAGAPAKASISIYAITQVPANTQFFQVQSDLTSQTVEINSSKDTTIYGGGTSASNGAGTLMWAGAEVELVIGGPFGFWSRRPRRPLLAFDILGPVPVNAQINNADLRLYASSIVGSGGVVSVYKVAPSPNGVIWSEGNALAPGSQFFGSTSSISAANWLARRSGTENWSTSGGDIEGGILDSLNVTSGTSWRVFSSAALDAAVQSMVDTRNDDDGFLMTGPGTSTLDFSDRGVAFISSEGSSFSLLRPTLMLNYTPTEPWSEGVVAVNTVSFTDEGDDFRWIYDTDEDDVLITEIGGVCEVLAYDPAQHTNFPYAYSYGGPTYTGVDCCTWYVESGASGTTGTGQALFFHNLDASDPANYPPDTDGDGIADLCDNCVAQANGPFVGTCVNGAVIGDTCNSDLECAAGETCNLSQQDVDLDGYGNACPVPEPGFAGGLMAAGALLTALSRGRRSRIDRRAVLTVLGPTLSPNLPESTLP